MGSYTDTASGTRADGRQAVHAGRYTDVETLTGLTFNTAVAAGGYVDTETSVREAPGSLSGRTGIYTDADAGRSGRQDNE